MAYQPPLLPQSGPNPYQQAPPPGPLARPFQNSQALIHPMLQQILMLHQLRQGLRP